jgi:hypothetical protein
VRVRPELMEAGERRAEVQRRIRIQFGNAYRNEVARFEIFCMPLIGIAGSIELVAGWILLDPVEPTMKLVENS